MDKKLLFIVNPRAGRTKSFAPLFDAVACFSKAGYLVKVFLTEGRGDATRAAAELGGAYDLVVCAGGDGTFNEMVSGLMQLDHPPVLGYIPFGSTNDCATTLGLSKVPRQAAIAAAEKGIPTPIDIGRLNGAPFVYVAAFGAFSAVSYETPQNMKNAMGHLAYIIEGVKRLPIGEKYPARVEVGDRVFEEEFLFCSISNTTSIGGFSLDKSVEATLDDGEFEVLLIKAPTSVAEANTIVSKLLARDFNNELIHLLHADSVTVHFPMPTKWTLDGEYGGEHTDVSVQVLANALHMVF